MPELHAIIRRMYGKNLSTIQTFCHDDAYKTESFPKKFQREEEDEVRFVHVMIEKFEFDIQTFSIDNMR